MVVDAGPDKCSGLGSKQTQLFGNMGRLGSIADRQGAKDRRDVHLDRGLGQAQFTADLFVRFAEYQGL